TSSRAATGLTSSTSDAGGGGGGQGPDVSGSESGLWARATGPGRPTPRADGLVVRAGAGRWTAALPAEAIRAGQPRRAAGRGAGGAWLGLGAGAEAGAWADATTCGADWPCGADWLRATVLQTTSWAVARAGKPSASNRAAHLERLASISCRPLVREPAPTHPG